MHFLPITAASDFDELVSMTTDKMRDSDPRECEYSVKVTLKVTVLCSGHTQGQNVVFLEPYTKCPKCPNLIQDDIVVCKNLLKSESEIIVVRPCPSDIQ